MARIVPVITKRAVSRPSDGDKKIIRWQKIAAEAAKQSGRGIVPEVSNMISFNEAVGEMIACEDALNIMPYECEANIKLRDILTTSSKKKINILHILKFECIIITIPQSNNKRKRFI